MGNLRNWGPESIWLKFFSQLLILLWSSFIKPKHKLTSPCPMSLPTLFANTQFRYVGYIGQTTPLSSWENYGKSEIYSAFFFTIFPDLPVKAFVFRDTLFSPGKTLNFAKFGTKWPNFYNFYMKFGKCRALYNVRTSVVFGQVKIYSDKFLFAPQTVFVSSLKQPWFQTQSFLLCLCAYPESKVGLLVPYRLLRPCTKSKLELGGQLERNFDSLSVVILQAKRIHISFNHRIQTWLKEVWL